MNKTSNTPKKSIKKRASKTVVSQDNRFIYAKYDMNANELKFFMWIVAQINSQRDQLFQICEIPLSEIFQVWQWKDTSEGYHYVRYICNSMAKKAYVEDFKLLDEATMKEKSVFQAMPLFKFIRYEQGQSYITYQLNDSLMEYLLKLDKNFTQLKFDDIQRMKSAYSIRIYNMLICELKQNRQSLKINLFVLQNILEVPKTLQEYKHFNQKVLAQAKKDINTKSNIVLLEVKTYKTGRKVTDLEFIFEYKNNEKRIQRDKEKQANYLKAIVEGIQPYVGKNLYYEQYKDRGEAIIESWEISEKENLVKVIHKFADGNRITFLARDIQTTIKALQEAKDKAEELFYSNDEKVQRAIDFRKQLESGSLFDKLAKKG